MLSEISQSQRTHTICFHLHQVLRVVEIIKTESKMGGPGAGEDDRELVFNGDRVPVPPGAERPGDEWRRWWCHNSANVPSAPELDA